MSNGTGNASSPHRGAVAKPSSGAGVGVDDGKHQATDRAPGLRADGLPDRRRSGPRLAWLPHDPMRTVLRANQGWLFDLHERDLTGVEKFLLGADHTTVEPSDDEIEADETFRGVEQELRALLGENSRAYTAAIRRARAVARRILWVSKVADRKLRQLIDARITAEVLKLHRQGHAIAQIAKKLDISQDAAQKRVTDAAIAATAAANVVETPVDAEPSSPKLDDCEIMRLLAAMAPPPADTAEDHPPAEEHGETLEAADVLPPITN